MKLALPFEAVSFATYAPVTQVSGMASVVVFCQWQATIPVTGSGGGIPWRTPGNEPSDAILRAPRPPYHPVRKTSMVKLGAVVVTKRSSEPPWLTLMADP